MAYKRKWMMFIDTSKCIGCKACQVACKQWHQLPPETTTFIGSYTNPPDVSGTTFTRVEYTEYEDIRNTLFFLFFKKQCMHCNQAECQILCPKGVEKTKEGFVIFNDKCIPANVKVSGDEAAKIAAFLACCPYEIPKYNSTLGRFVKCDFCFDRFGGGYGVYTTYRDGQPTTACELACPPGAIKTGAAKDIMNMAKQRLAVVKDTYDKATLWGGRGRVIFLLTQPREAYNLPPAD
ncbi:MAG: 4Fe-4S dicluster domain-containing protein [Nitrospirae bacterium]|nr:4Fe-4S dicluster domain-containing protein [Nitrospirota bacterium]